MAFLLATTTWVSTVLINASPFMRFDGYFLLSDFLQMPNLHARAFALARWDLRERLFALGEPAPEHFPAAAARTDPVRLGHLDLPPGPVPGHRGPGLSLLHQGPGHLSFLVEIVWFIARPLWSEIGAWRQRARLSAAAGARERAAADPDRAGCLRALARAGARQRPVASARAMAAACAGSVATGLAPPAEGHALQAHEDAFVLDTPSLAASAAQSQARSLQLARQSAAAGFDPELRRDWQVLRERQAEAQAQQVAVDSEAARYRLEAPGAGRLRDRDPDLRQGDWLGRRELLGRVVSAGPLQVVAYVPRMPCRACAPADGALHRRWRRRTGPGSARAQHRPGRHPRAAGSGAVRPAGGDVQVRASQNLLYRNGRCTG